MIGILITAMKTTQFLIGQAMGSDKETYSLPNRVVFNIEEFSAMYLRNSRYEIPDTRYEIPDTRYEIPDTKYQIPDMLGWFCRYLKLVFTVL